MDGYWSYTLGRWVDGERPEGDMVRPSSDSVYAMNTGRIVSMIDEAWGEACGGMGEAYRKQVEEEQAKYEAKYQADLRREYIDHIAAKAMQALIPAYCAYDRATVAARAYDMAEAMWDEKQRRGNV